MNNDHYIYHLLNDPHYRVNKNGKIYTRISKTGKVFTNPQEWRLATSSRHGKIEIKYNYKNLSVARIIYAKFIGRLQDGLYVYHKDHNPSNNHASNLLIGTRAQLNKHSIQNPNKKHNPIRNKVIDFKIAQRIRYLRTLGYSYKTLCEITGLSKSTISYVVNYKTWVPSKF